jgi:hypothetical protein
MMDLLFIATPFFAWVGASLVYRLANGKPVFYRRLPCVRFREVSASGNSNRSWLTELGGARNCLVVQLTEQELDIHPFVPFNWCFLPEIYDLEFRVAIERIRSVTRRKNLFAQSLQIEFTTADEKRHSVSLVLRREEHFLEALRANPLFTGALPA